MLEYIMSIILKLFHKEDKKMLTIEQLHEINGKLNKAECEYYLDALNEVLPKYEINTKLRLCHFLSQVIHESGHLKYKVENLNYSSKALRSVFCKYFKTDAVANEYARKPEKIANRVYADRMGNGNEVSGEGWKYRGRGLLQLTGKCNYKECGEYLGLDLVNNPDLICNDPKVNIMSACWYWHKNKLNELADKDDCKSCTKKINGGLNGYDDRTKILCTAKSILKD